MMCQMDCALHENRSLSLFILIVFSIVFLMHREPAACTGQWSDLQGTKLPFETLLDAPRRANTMSRSAAAHGGRGSRWTAEDCGDIQLSPLTSEETFLDLRVISELFITFLFNLSWLLAELNQSCDGPSKWRRSLKPVCVTKSCARNVQMYQFLCGLSYKRCPINVNQKKKN